jgi:hypothetical protein
MIARKRFWLSRETVAPGKLSPSAFMRRLRPENYSDTAERASYVLDAPVLEYHLETLTARNQTHDFEIFCRKLCEKVICPNLRPQTGPDGGGDSKADTETFPVADEITTLTFVGEPKAGAERWAFAFSAKADWRRKVRDDVAGIVGTDRGYARIICVTSRHAKAKTRATLEDELAAKYGLPVTIHDRSWIVQQIVDNDRRELAYHYLHVGQEVVTAHRLGPSDYSRAGQLEAIETSLADPDGFIGMLIQQVTEALLAAKLSRSLELPRSETDGRFQRAIRLADDHGTFRQKLATRYEALWTAVWWFDDIDLIKAEYDRFEAMAIGSGHAINLEFISNLLQTLFNAVIHGHYEKAECDLEARAGRLYARLDAVASENEWPNNALRAQTLRLLGRLNIAMLEKDAAAISGAWPEFSGILADARNLGEYDASQLLKLILISP